MIFRVLYNPRVNDLYLEEGDNMTIKNEPAYEENMENIISSIEGDFTPKKHTLDDHCDVECFIDYQSRKVILTNDRGSMMECGILDVEDNIPFSHEFNRIVCYSELQNGSYIIHLQFTP